MATESERQPHRRESLGLLFGFIGVLSFSFTLPATRLAVATLHPAIVGLGRAVVAACLALPLLLITRQPLPDKAQWRSLTLVMIGVVIGFPLLSAWAMQVTSASHGAIVLALLPLATALAGALRAHERPSAQFWLASVAGSATVLIYAIYVGGAVLQLGDLALLGAVALAALGYAEGGRVARQLGGWQVICWALVLSMPVLIVPVVLVVRQHGLVASAASWWGFAYVSLVSMFLGFFAWYHGLALGGVARVSQLQLLQPFLTLALSALFLHETFGSGAMLAAALVALSILISRRSRIGK